jgi:DNA polymerase V
VEYALLALKSIFREGYQFKKAGVIVSGIVPENAVQNCLFDEINREKHAHLLSSVDEINERYGRDTVKLAVLGYKRKWKLRQEQLSPFYTTSWNDIISVRI